MGSNSAGNVKGSLDPITVYRHTSLKDVLHRHERAADFGLPAGIVIVVDEGGRLVGTVTDGDARRALLTRPALDIKAEEAMQADPIVFSDGIDYQQILRQLPHELEQRGRRSRRFLGKIVTVDEHKKPVRIIDYHQLWEQRVATHRHVVVVGMGYVGLTLALELAEEGFLVTGVDVDSDNVERLLNGNSHIHERGLPELLREQLQGNFSVSHALPDGGDVFVIAVGTPVRHVSNGSPEIVRDHLDRAMNMVGEKLTPGALVILRSTVPVGYTRSRGLALLEQSSGLRAGFDFHLAIAPERTVEGRALEELRELPQIIGGLNGDSVEATAALFRELTPTIVRVDSLEAAEMAKLINNGFRDLVFAFANEMAQAASAHNLDIIEVIRAANHGYPRDQVPLPSPGVGGPCLTKDPYILAATVENAHRASTLSQHGRSVNESMHPFVAEATISKLTELGKDPGLARVLICGMAFKGRPETADMRDSSSMMIARELEARVGEVFIHDPVVPWEELAATGFQLLDSAQHPAGMDAVLFLNNHPDYQRLDVFELARSLVSPGILFDAWRLFRPDDVLSAAPCVYMGLGFARSSLAGELGGSQYRSQVEAHRTS